MLTKAFKSEKIDEIKSKIEKAQVAVITEYKGFTVEEITKLRRELQKDGGDYMVTKNTLTKIAVKGTAYEAISEKMTGPIALAFGFALHFSEVRFCILLLTIVMVISAEMMNSAIEFALDSIYHNKYSKMVGMAKDIAAGAVMIVTVVALMVGVLLFVPPIYKIILG